MISASFRLSLRKNKNSNGWQKRAENPAVVQIVLSYVRTLRFPPFDPTRFVTFFGRILSLPIEPTDFLREAWKSFPTLAGSLWLRALFKLGLCLKNEIFTELPPRMACRIEEVSGVFEALLNQCKFTSARWALWLEGDLNNPLDVFPASQAYSENREANSRRSEARMIFSR